MNHYDNFLLSISVSPFDYFAVTTILMFDACQMRSCVNVTIRNDVILENLESFNVALERTSDLDSRITLNLVNEVVVIIDNDGMHDDYMVIHREDT